jgi:hypothetical protein
MYGGSCIDRSPPWRLLAVITQSNTQSETLPFQAGTARYPRICLCFRKGRLMSQRTRERAPSRIYVITKNAGATGLGAENCFRAKKLGSAIDFQSTHGRNIAVDFRICSSCIGMQLHAEFLVTERCSEQPAISHQLALARSLGHRLPVARVETSRFQAVRPGNPASKSGFSSLAVSKFRGESRIGQEKKPPLLDALYGRASDGIPVTAQQCEYVL